MYGRLLRVIWILYHPHLQPEPRSITLTFTIVSQRLLQSGLAHANHTSPTLSTHQSNRRKYRIYRASII
jgi:predicted RNA polymerase sigma factor